MRLSDIICESALVEITPELIDEVTEEMLRRGFEIPEGEDGERDEDYVHYLILGALDEISTAIVGDELSIYRAIEIDNIKQLNLTNLGIYWTTNPSMAITYNGANHLFWLTIQAMVKVSAIYWPGVLAVHLFGGEDEITLSKGTEVRIVKAKWITHKHKSSNLKLPPAPRGLVGRLAHA
jgi:hypothetical protein